MGTPEIREADFVSPMHRAAIVRLLDEYASGLTGGGRGLADDVKQNLVSALKQRPDSVVILAVADDEAVGLVIAFEGFSTFACRPLLNIHDVVVSESHRRQGLATRMLEKAEEIARRRGCCKLTLEVLEANHGACEAYEAFGFRSYELDPKMGRALFWEKKLG